MKQSRVRTSASSTPSPSSSSSLGSSHGKSELQRKLQSMVISCRDNNNNPNNPSSNGNNNGVGMKLSNTELRIKRAEAQSQMNFAKTSPAAINVLPIESSLGSHKSNLDPLQNCYGRPSMAAGNNGPRGILTKPSTPKLAKGKRVTWNLDLESDIPSRPDSPYNPEPIISSAAAASAAAGTGAFLNSSLPNVEQKSPMSTPKKNLFQPSKPTRPSLSEQLSLIANKASDLTSEIKAKAGITETLTGTNEQPILTSPAKNFTVGNLQCRYPSPAIFYRDRLEYIFHHPFQTTEIHLILYYRDMQSLTLSPNPQPGKVHFRVPRKLVHFASDYDPTKHYVTLFLSSSAALESIRSDILPLIPGRNSIIGSSLLKFTTPSSV